MLKKIKDKTQSSRKKKQIKILLLVVFLQGRGAAWHFRRFFVVDPWQRLPGAFLLRLPEPENSQTGHDGLQTGGERRQSKIIARASLQQRNREYPFVPYHIKSLHDSEKNNYVAT